MKTKRASSKPGRKPGYIVNQKTDLPLGVERAVAAREAALKAKGVDVEKIKEDAKATAKKLAKEEKSSKSAEA